MNKKSKWVALKYAPIGDWGHLIPTDIRVEWRGLGYWAITKPGGHVLNNRWEWETEPKDPNDRTMEFLNRTRYSLDEAQSKVNSLLGNLELVKEDLKG